MTLVEARHVSMLGQVGSKDYDIFFAAREVRAIVVTKDEDFVHLLERHGPPPQVVWMTCGNVRNAQLQEIVRARWPLALKLLERGEPLVEIGR